MITKLEYEWTLDEALLFIRQLQPLAKTFNYHLALGGGVLNNGYSYKDLDIICMGMHNDEKNRKEDLISKFQTDYNAILESNEEYSMDTRELYRMNYNGKSIDLFLYD